MSTAKLSEKNQIVIPKSVRQSLKLTAGSRITLIPLDGHRAILVKQSSNRVLALKGLGKEVWSKLGGASKYIQQERSSW